MYVPGIKFSIDQRSQRHGNCAESQKLKKTRDYLGSARNDRGALLRGRAVPNAHAQSDTEEFDNIANENRIYGASFEERASHRETNTRSPNLTKEESGTL